MRPITALIIVIAVLFSGLSAFMAKNIVKQKPPEMVLAEDGTAIKAEPMTDVLVASSNISMGAVLRSSDLRWQRWPKAATNKDFVIGGSNKLRDDYVGKIASNQIRKGEPIVAASLFTQDNAGLFSGLLSPGMRGFGLSVNSKMGMTGHIQPGDRIDVIMTAKVFGLGKGQRDAVAQKNFSETIVQNIRVLAVENEFINPNAIAKDDGKKKKKAKPKKLPKTMTLEVTPKQAEALTIAQKMGDIMIVLRPLTDFANPVSYNDEGITSDLDVSRVINSIFRGETSESLKNKSFVSPYDLRKLSSKKIKVILGNEVTIQSVAK